MGLDAERRPGPSSRSQDDVGGDFKTHWVYAPHTPIVSERADTNAEYVEIHRRLERLAHRSETARRHDGGCSEEVSAADARRQVVRHLGEVEELAREHAEAVEVGEVGGEPE
jgi:hypothetical protein